MFDIFSKNYLIQITHIEKGYIKNLKSGFHIVRIRNSGNLRTLFFPKYMLENFLKLFSKMFSSMDCLVKLAPFLGPYRGLMRKNAKYIFAYSQRHKS